MHERDLPAVQQRPQSRGCQCIESESSRDQRDLAIQAAQVCAGGSIDRHELMCVALSVKAIEDLTGGDSRRPVGRFVKDVGNANHLIEVATTQATDTDQEFDFRSSIENRRHPRFAVMLTCRSL